MLIVRVIAAVLALLSVLPLWRILPTHATGIAGVATAQEAAAYSSMIWNGVILAAIPGLIFAMFVDPIAFEDRLKRLCSPLTALRPARYALLCSAVAFALSAFVALAVVKGLPTLIDSFAQLLQARYFADGKLAGPVGSAQAFWHIQQTVVTKNGWVSQYPPGYAVLLAIGFRLHFVMLVGPLLFAVAIYYTARIAEIIAPNVIIGRVAALLAAVSPFMLGMSGAYMSHVPAAAFSAAALYYVLQRKPLQAGLFIGMLFTVRPLTAVVAAVVAIIFSERNVRSVGLAFVAALPFLVVVASYNKHFFGSPFTFGYNAALGPHAGLGWGFDPWGNQYGITDAFAYTSAELSALSLYMLETPLPLIALLGLYFAQTPKFSNSQILAFVWASALVIANLAYWHHGLFMGPRMLADHGPLWVVLTVIACAELVRGIRADWLIAERFAVRSFAGGALVSALLAGLLIFTPQRLSSYTITPEIEALLRAPKMPETLAFVRGGWTSRIAMTMAGRGMRLDSVETALRQNSTCAVHRFVKGENLALDFTPDARKTVHAVEVSPGNRIRMQPNEQLTPECKAEADADSQGVVDVTPYIWQGDLPGLKAGGTLWVRDLGAASDTALARMQPNRKRVSWGVR